MRGWSIFVDFKGRGLGELPRLLLADAGIAFDDVRLEDISALKSKFPFEQVPVYEEQNGFMLAQSRTISRYIARQTGTRHAHSMPLL